MSETLTLTQSYAECKKLNRRYGSTYYWSAALLPRDKRHSVHALYAFCRYADDIVDDLGDTGIGEREVALASFGDRFFIDLTRGRSDDPILMAVVDTVQRLEIDPQCFRRFLNSMSMDFSISTYETFDDLMEYMDGSAAVIGEMMLPVLQPITPSAIEPARQLGIAFQLTNFLRDVNEDLDRGRIYVPQETLRQYGADPQVRKVTPEWSQAMRHEIARTREIYRAADSGLALLPDSSARCVGAARRLYSGILDRIEGYGYVVFSRRARVPYWRKLAAAATILG